MSKRKSLDQKTILSYDQAVEFMEINESTFKRYKSLIDFPQPVMIRGKQHFMRKELQTWYDTYRRDYNGEVLDFEEMKLKSLLTRQETILYTGLSDKRIAKQIKDKTFPEQVRLFKCSFFLRSELDEWLARQKDLQEKER